MTIDWNPDDPDSTRVHYDLSGWSFDQQAELASDLAEAEIPHVWDGPELLVPDDFETAADAAIAIVEERLGITDEAEIGQGDELPEPIELAEDTLTTEYDLAEWDDRERGAVGSMLTRQHLPFRWNEDHVLLIATQHEQAVEAILDSVESGGDLEPVIEREADGSKPTPAVGQADTRLPFETLTTFFLAAERLKRDPLDADGLGQLLKALEVADDDNPPYGVEKPLWDRTCELADELADALAEEDEPDEDEAREVAIELHDLLRPFI